MPRPPTTSATGPGCSRWSPPRASSASRPISTPGDLYYAHELPGPEATVVYTRATPPGSPRPPGRLTVADLPTDLDPALTAYVCGSSAFANHATDLLLTAGVPTSQIRVERFGPT